MTSTDDTEPSNGSRDVQSRLDKAARDQFPVLVDFNRRIENLERKVSRVRDLTLLAIGVGLGIAFGELVENWGSPLGWSWGSAVTCAITILAVILIIRPYLK